MEILVKFAVFEASVQVWAIFRSHASVLDSFSLVCFASVREDIHSCTDATAKLSLGKLKKFSKWYVENRSDGISRKCAYKNFNTFRKCVKIRYLALQNAGRKCVKFLQILFVFQEFLLSLQPNN